MKENVGNEIYSWIKSLALALIIAFIVRQFLFSPMNVIGESMLPTFENKDKVMVSKLSYLQRFDIVVFDAPDANEYYIKRVIGLPGDSIEMKDEVLYINGKEIEQPYLEGIKGDNNSSGMRTGDFTLQELTGETKVPEGSLFVLGDNRIISKDSRSFGFVSKESIIGEVKFQYYPLDRIGIPK
ncbi:signal peptidase I [Bacillus cereus]|uniref:Signal peptidase I n=1 Tax=Bacillus cereus TaxID=1396 RepID=A0A9X0MHF8_BACCE|nr:MULTISPECIES: signal peptidase I [Bacillus cereus group]KXY43356.1 hypothetical protein AT268_27690 [Bacillus cereus]MCU4825395.1 signal peptidase I [Bacillus cereus]MCU4858271.1 signal peptidase I [Bacillus cereus]MCU4875005.1 signal peptidase I [Bacillus cereus]MCU4943317.1 signal peptidase I [Bacillus cereus]